MKTANTTTEKKNVAPTIGSLLVSDLTEKAEKMECSGKSKPLPKMGAGIRGRA